MSAPDTLPEGVLRAVGAARDKHALDLKVLDLRKVASFADYFVILSGSSTRQVQALADAVSEAMRASGAVRLHREGYEQAEWVLLDYADVVVHVFSPVKRHFYDLERLWRDAEVVELPGQAA